MSQNKAAILSAALLAFVSLTNVAKAENTDCKSLPLTVPKDLAAYMNKDGSTKDISKLDNATKYRLNEFLKSQKEAIDLGQEQCLLLRGLYENDKKREAVFKKWDDPNVHTKITTQFDSYVRASQCKQ